VTETPELLMLLGMFLLGFIVGRVRRTRTGGTSLEQKRCSCGHAYSFHNPKGSCQRTVMRNGAAITCECVRYDGPTPLAELYAPEISDT